MKTEYVNNTEDMMYLINDAVYRLAMAKEDFSITWDTLISELREPDLYKELEEFWHDMNTEIKENAPEIHQKYLSHVTLSTVIRLDDLATHWYDFSDDKREESEKIQKALASVEHDTNNYMKILYGCAMQTFLSCFIWEDILDQVKEILGSNVDDKTATQYFACNCFIPFANFLINDIEEYRDGNHSDIADAWAFCPY